MGIGKRIKEARNALELTQEELAKLLGVTKGAVANYENETSHPKEPIMYKLLSVLKVDANYLFQDVVNIPNQKNDVSLTEYEHIKRYRLLDECGRQHVDDVLSWEIDRVTLQTQNEALISQQTQYITELEKRSTINLIPLESCRPVRFYQTYPSPATGKVMWDDIKIDNTEIPDNDENKEGDYLITMDDDSMAPLFWRTDILLVKETDKIELGEIGVFTLNGVCYIKELGKNKLISRNPDFPPIMFDKSLECKGKVLRNLMEHTEDEIKYLTERKDHIRRYQETYQMVAENGLNDDDETRKLVQKIVDSLKETPDSND